MSCGGSMDTHNVLQLLEYLCRFVFKIGPSHQFLTYGGWVIREPANEADSN